MESNIQLHYLQYNQDNYVDNEVYTITTWQTLKEMLSKLIYYYNVILIDSQHNFI